MQMSNVEYQMYLLRDVARLHAVVGDTKRLGQHYSSAA